MSPQNVNIDEMTSIHHIINCIEIRSRFMK